MDSPAFVYDMAEIIRTAERMHAVAREASCNLCYSIKACSVPAVLKQLAPRVEGFSCSSPFEVSLADEMRAARQSLHFTSPCIRPDDIELILETCDYVVFNSLSQWTRFRPAGQRQVACGIRVNPELPLVEDDRYNPCRLGSKLGVPISELRGVHTGNGTTLKGISGVHVHTNCDSEDFGQLLATVQRMDEGIPKVLDRVQWVNLGGGYLFEEDLDYRPLFQAVDLLARKYGLGVFIEPGAAAVRSAGSLVATVSDLFERDGCRIAVLDASVNHLPETFEYNYKVDVTNEVDDGDHTYTLAGSSCLAGDLFGEYTFDAPLRVGQRLVFEDVGAYSLVRAHRFNGINLPSVYEYGCDGELLLRKAFDYDDFLSGCGGDVYAVD